MLQSKLSTRKAFATLTVAALSFVGLSAITAPANATETISMTLEGPAVLGSDMTISFIDGAKIQGNFYDVWMCPNKDVMPVDLGAIGDCVAVTFWNRNVVAGYSQQTTARTMTWLLSNEDVPGRVSPSGLSYLDGSSATIPMSPPSEDGGWCAYENWFMIVHDFDGVDGMHGLHSNWSPAIGAAGCSEPASSPSAPVDSPRMVVIDVNPTNITIDNEIITIFGANLDSATEVYIDGILVKIISQSGNRLQIKAPKGLSGLVNLELRSLLNDILLTKELNYGSTAAVGTKKRVLIVGGFAHNSRKLTPKMQAKIERWLEKNSDLGTLTCTGFTSLPRRTTDIALSSNRGTTACNFAERQREELETSVSKGIEDPRPGSNVRRVKLVLTP